MSLDGYVAGPDQDLEHPLGDAVGAYDCVELVPGESVAHARLERAKA
jgi:hypothetical protein